MGRNLKRVPMDFNWPLKQVWKGYINPFHSQQCKACDQSGYNPATKAISDGWYSFEHSEYIYTHGGQRRYNNLAWCNHITEVEIKALIEADRLWDFTRVPKNEQQAADIKAKGGGWLPYSNGYIPTPEEVNNWNRNGMGHDAINRGICIEARSKHLGVYGLCEYCNGEGEIWLSDEIKKLHDEWEEFDPPTGDGYQMWESTSEGSPQSPVFASLDELCGWLANTGASVFGSHTATREEWMEMLNRDNVHYKDAHGNIFM